MSAFKAKSKPTFKSYVDNNGDFDADGTSNIYKGRKKDRVSKFFVDRDAEKVNLEVNLLPGEIVISKVPEVRRFVSYTEGCRGHTGTFYVTNFKVSFVTVDLYEPSNQNSASQALTRVNKLIGANDIALTSICDLYQVVKGKRKRLTPGIMLPAFTQELEICCKYFQTHNFTFNGDIESSKRAVNAILHHAFPARLDLFFAFSFKRPIPSNTSISEEDEMLDSQVKDYLCVGDWESELERLNVSGFRVTSCNMYFDLSLSLPEHFIVPESLSDSIMREQKCFPLWCYTHRSGTSLVRMARCDDFVANEIMSHIKISHSRNRKPEIIDLNSTKYNMPTLKELQISLEKLREACMPLTTKDLTSLDNSWFSSVEESGWLNHISNVLSLVCLIVDRIAFINRSVLIIEDGEGRDWSPLISSLSQLCMDSYCRTLKGFEELVERGWNSLGHPFRDRIFYNKLSKDEQSPVFQLFLDCVWQLTRQFPSSFQFNTIFLTTLSDSIHLGVFRNFVFNSTKERVDRTFWESKDQGSVASRVSGNLDSRQSFLSATLPVTKSPSVYKVLPAARTPISKTLPANQTPPSYKVLPSLRPGATPTLGTTTNEMQESYRVLTTHYSEISVSALEPVIYDEEVCKVLTRSPSSSSDTPSLSSQSPTSLMSTPCLTQNQNTSINLATVWDWLIQFNQSEINAFNNPLYKAADISRRLRAVDDRYNLSCVTAAQSSPSLHRGKVVRDTGRILRLVEDALKPCANVPCLRLWEHCYLRWLSPILLMNGGGEPAEQLAQQRILREIERLQNEINKYENYPLDSDRNKAKHSADSFNYTFDDISSRSFEQNKTARSQEEITSSSDLSSQNYTRMLNPAETASYMSQSLNDFIVTNQVRSLESVVSSSYPYWLEVTASGVPFISAGGPMVDSMLAAYDDSTSIYDVDEN